MRNKKEEKPVVIAQGKLMATGRKFQYILVNGVKKFVWGDNCVKLIFIMCVAALSSCEVFSPEVDEDIAPYVNSFFEEARLRGIKIQRPSIFTVKFRHIPDGDQGKCIFPLNAIYINKKSHGWLDNPEALVFHEMAHLFLNRKHNNKMINGYCVSIMNHNDDPVYDSYDLSNRREYYLNELFTGLSSEQEWMH